MPEKDFSHRDVVDKLGVKPGHVVLLDERAGPVAPELMARILARVGRPPVADDEPADLVLLTADADTDVEAALRLWRPRLAAAGGVWVFTPKRKQPGYVDQNEVMAAGLAAGLVDNKVCSISDTTSAMRFVIRRADRPRS